MAQKNHTYKLNDEIHHIPMIGLGTYNGTKANEVGDAVKIALKSGYRHIDTAAVYGNEKEIGHALKEVFAEGEIQREDVFIVSKLWNSCHNANLVRKHCEKSISDLGLQYLDLYLIHWPVAFENADPEGLTIDPIKDSNGNVKLANVSIRETWTEMEKLVEAGLVKSIGVSNFNVQNLIDLLTYCKIKPAINQLELHPYLNQHNLKGFCDKYNIILTAYSPLGASKNDLTTNEVIQSIANKHKKSVPNVIFRWCIQYGVSVIPKSVTPSRIIENFDIFDFELSKEDMDQLNNLNRGEKGRTCSPIKQWGIPLFD